MVTQKRSQWDGSFEHQQHNHKVIETVLLSTHNICFGWKKIMFCYELLTKGLYMFAILCRSSLFISFRVGSRKGKNNNNNNNNKNVITLFSGIYRYFFHETNNLLCHLIQSPSRYDVSTLFCILQPWSIVSYKIIKVIHLREYCGMATGHSKSLLFGGR